MLCIIVIFCSLLLQFSFVRSLKFFYSLLLQFFFICSYYSSFLALIRVLQLFGAVLRDSLSASSVQRRARGGGGGRMEDMRGLVKRKGAFHPILPSSCTHFHLCDGGICPPSPPSPCVLIPGKFLEIVKWADANIFLAAFHAKTMTFEDCYSVLCAKTQSAIIPEQFTVKAQEPLIPR